MLSIAEATALGVKSGMDPKLLYEVMRVSTARCWSVDTYNPVPGNFKNKFNRCVAKCAFK